MKEIIPVAVPGLAEILSSPAQAANDSASVSVTINLASRCVFGTVTPLLFARTTFRAALST